MLSILKKIALSSRLALHIKEAYLFTFLPKVGSSAINSYDCYQNV
jgi:hypothetical protein